MDSRECICFAHVGHLSNIDSDCPIHGTKASQRDDMHQGSSSVVERLKWWLEYFNDPQPKKFENVHPNHSHDPTGFDETAIEADLLDAIAEIERLEKEVDELRAWQTEGMKHDLKMTAEIERLEKEYGEACKVIRHMEDRVREWRAENAKLREALERIRDGYPGGKTAAGAFQMIATKALGAEDG